MTYEELTVPAEDIRINLDVPDLDDLGDYDVSQKFLLESKTILTDDIMIELNLNDTSIMDDVLNNNIAIIKKSLKLVQRRQIALKMVNMQEGSLFYTLMESELAEYNTLKKKFKNLNLSSSIPVTRHIRIKNLF